MSQSPIEFLSEQPNRFRDATEYGGVDALIQPPPHTMTPREANSAMMRAAMNSTDGVDPVTGLTVPDDLNSAV
jgi:hypothetical protein